ncbi:MULTISPECIES: 4-(cytidine 5'-diphospho)-2-C-methyl-D-erythritol kinase [unclassified Carboxylicivirga]|uniref:4-(cytidine 5'-diphospho)-2-C-methyl-D-erythritol kinase n=1 Tax=Carboxylicivirga TaxID=1628153 RepID=UPI003D328F16
MICYPNAKINIGLNITEKRADGYHNLETIFYPIPLSDALEAVIAEEANTPYTYSNSGIEVDAPVDENICIKALKLLKEEKVLPPIHIHLHKQIPFGAGLGGGSADGAFMLKLLNKEFKLGLSKVQLHALATRLGADCPFFINNQPAYATGIGEILEPLEMNLKGYHIALLKPPVHVSTPEAFAGIVPRQSSQSLKELIKLPLAQWKHHIKNDFEKSVFAQYPIIGKLKHDMYEAGAEYAAMSGSGSAVYGFFRKQPELPAYEGLFSWSKVL